jgi:hypothetical protein
MGRRLVANVALRNAETDAVEVFEAGSTLPSWAEKLVTNDAVFEGGADEAAASEAPPRAGRGSGRDEWAAYASSLGVAFDDDATRDEIVAAVDAAS